MGTVGSQRSHSTCSRSRPTNSAGNLYMQSKGPRPAQRHSVHVGPWCMGVTRAKRLAEMAQLIAAMSLDAFDGRLERFRRRSKPCAPSCRSDQGCRNNAPSAPRQRDCSSAQKHVQDPYSFRCIPQVHGAVFDAIDFVEARLEEEINAPTDNPTIFPRRGYNRVGGQLPGEPIAMPMDYLALALTELSSISGDVSTNLSAALAICPRSWWQSPASTAAS